MTHHAAANPKRIPHPKHQAAHKQASTQRRASTVESTNVVVGSGADFGGISVGSASSGTFPGVFLTSSGLAAYNASGVQTMFIDASSGNVAITGTGVFLGSEFLSNFGFPRIQLDNSGLATYNSAGVPTVTISSSTGDIVSTGPTSKITGGTIETSAAGVNPRVAINSSGLHAYNGAGTEIVTISTTTGILESTGGVITAGTIQTATSGARVVFDTGGLRAFNAAGTNTVNIDTSGHLTVLSGSITLSSVVPAGTGARIVLDATGIKAYDATNTQKFVLDGTTGIIQATGIILAQPGSSLPINTLAGLLPGSANRYSNSAFQNGANTFDSTGWSTDATCTLSNGGTSAPPVYGALVLQATITTGTTISAYVYANNVINSFMRVLPGLSYTFSHYVYPTTVARNSQVDVQWFNSSGTNIAAVSGTPKSTTLNAWTRVSQTATAPAGAAYGRGVHYFALGGLNAEIYYLDCFQMEEGDRVSAWAPRPDEILVNQINANHINVANLSAINADLGSITAGSVTGVTITGATITGGTVQAASSGARAVIDATNDFYLTNSSGQQVFRIDRSEGMVMAASAGSPAEISWQTGSSLAAIASGPILTHQIGAGEFASNTQNRLEIVSYRPGVTGILQSLLTLQAATSANTDSFMKLAIGNAANTASYNITILDGADQSDFARTPSKPRMRIDGGTGSVSFSSATVSSTNTVTGSYPYTNSAICVATATLSSLPFGIPPWFKCDWVSSSNPPQFNITGYYTNTAVSGTSWFYYIILAW